MDSPELYFLVAPKWHRCTYLGQAALRVGRPLSSMSGLRLVGPRLLVWADWFFSAPVSLKNAEAWISRSVQDYWRTGARYPTLAAAKRGPELLSPEVPAHYLRALMLRYESSQDPEQLGELKRLVADLPDSSPERVKVQIWAQAARDHQKRDLALLGRLPEEFRAAALEAALPAALTKKP